MKKLFQCPDFSVYLKTVSAFSTNCYIVEMTAPQKDVIIIDPGDDQSGILFDLDKHKMKPTMIFITHCHIDHLMAAEDIRTKFRIPVYAHVEYPSAMKYIPLQMKMFGFDNAVPPGIDHFLRDNDIIKDKISILHTPGHSQDSICIYFERVLFSGDTLFKGSIGRTDLPGGNYKQIIHSIRSKVLTLPDETAVLPGHGPRTTIKDEMDSNPFL